ncbi:U3 snoRNP-associated protein Utp7 [Thecamonas trahens ATCC 50062]|uniref:U3 snoRNP-associated protein Utp7 n=1 Tax=Thecamonas trahens ATCC 50062 TaxID=461836 RepID=A0A0L0D3Y4_THETB|nr:U3 snoRNP-associated protein Utp7 [Thecamonas trahens ATCC 50062]KNC46018.1 U3 snoRNP-associated protein Utp7 [Thecamonas trahens ATCC 50062]|eukprot:XP_013762998.1 U3 snoRNP-associated protein Utp7 [Thecamonas trahens ATCC 50062]
MARRKRKASRSTEDTASHKAVEDTSSRPSKRHRLLGGQDDGQDGSPTERRQGAGGRLGAGGWVVASDDDEKEAAPAFASTARRGKNGGKKARSREKVGPLKPTRNELRAMRRQFDDKVAEYERGLRPSKKEIKSVQDVKQRMELRTGEKNRRKAAEDAAAAELLLHTQESGYLEAEGMEKTYKFKQADIAGAVDLQSAAKHFDLALEYGSYSIDYSRNGKHLLLGGRRGHLALMDWSRASLLFEMFVEESIYDVKILHNHMFLGVAQKSNLFIYDHTGLELHCLRDHPGARHLEFLPYHFLLASVGETGRLRYVDISTGEVIANHRVKNGAARALTANPHNAVMAVGTAAGIVSHWVPNTGLPVVKMVTHAGPVTGIAFSSDGNVMATTGMDRTVRVWDMRMYKELHTPYTLKRPASAIDISQRGMLAIGFGTHVDVWKDALRTRAQRPYLSYGTRGAAVSDLAFVPYEDVLGLGSAKGVTSLLVPGAGEPNFDSYVANPYETTKQRQEGEVKRLLDKIPADMITLDNSVIGALDANAENNAMDILREKHESIHGKGTWKPRNKARGKNKSYRKLLRKKGNIRSRKMLRVKAYLDAKKRAAEELDAKGAGGQAPPPASRSSMFSRFKK